MNISYSVKKRYLALFILIIVCFITSCSPLKPYPSRIFFGNIEEVVIKPVSINSVRLVDQPLFDSQSKIAVFNFDAPEGTQGGVLVSDMFTSILEEKGLGKILERDNIDKILREQSLIEGNKTFLTDLEVATRLGKLVSADYMVFGTVTLYQSEPQTIYIPIHFNQEDIKEYEEEYVKYKKWYLKRLFPLREPERERIKRLRNEEKVFSQEELEDSYSKISKAEYQVIASVGISAKVVDVKSGKIIWLGQAATNDFTIVNATKRILTKFLESIQNSEKNIKVR